ncbi:MAG: hypothetical protein JO290_09215 [Sphingomonadaceae bacterium]|nr:hypothetical protein [Sphingomonadaceae bacterium]
MAAPSIHVEHIGEEGEPIVVVDGFAPDPDALRAHAARQVFGSDDTYYPGVKARVPPTYFSGCETTLAVVLRDVFGHRAPPAVLGAWYQIVTTPPAALSPMQRLPHVDATGPAQVAMVHYLSHDDQGGTGFFRHRASGYETIDPARAKGFYAGLDAEVQRTPPLPVYLSDGAPWFERIAAVAPAYNRAVLYRSRLLHSGLIPPGASLSPDPARGRLTVGCFFAADPGGRAAP